MKSEYKSPEIKVVDYNNVVATSSEVETERIPLTAVSEDLYNT